MQRYKTITYTRIMKRNQICSPMEENMFSSGFYVSNQKEPEEMNVESRSPAGEHVELKEIIDIISIQSLMNDFYKLTHIPMGLDDLTGRSVVSVGWQDICTKFHRIHPETCKFCFESNKNLSSGIPHGEIKEYKCLNNMWDIATPITVDNHHIGNIVAGQFFFEEEPIDYDLFRSQARKHGFNEKEYLEALNKVPRFSREYVDIGMSFFRALANMISQLSYSNIMLSRSLSVCNELVDALQFSESKYRQIIETSQEGIWILDNNGRTVFVNQKVSDMLGYRIDEIIGQLPHKFLAPKFRDFLVERLNDLKQKVNPAIDFQLVRKDGSDLWCILSTSPLFDKEEKYIGLLGMLIDITERKKAEEKLKESEEKYRIIVETANEGIVKINNELVISYANQKMVDMLGYAMKDVVGKTIWNCVSEEHKPFFKTNMEKEKQGISESGELRLKCKDGTDIWTCINFKSLFDSEGNYSGLIGMFTDITKLKNTENSLKESLFSLDVKVRERTKELEMALNSFKEIKRGLAEAQVMAHIGNWDRNLITGDVYWSDEMRRIFCHNPQEPLPAFKEIFNLMHQDDIANVRDALKEAFNGKPLSVDYRAILPNEDERFIHVKGEVVFDEKNNPVRVKGIVQDITELRRSEEKIRNLASIVESSNDAIGTISPDGIVKSWNKGGEHIYGYSTDEIIGKSISLVAPPHLSEETKELGELVKQGRKIHNYETKRIKKDGNLIDVSMTLSPVFDIQGKLISTSFISRDITENKKAEEKLLQEKKNAEVANRTKSDFLANISHELRTPLNSIIGFSDLLNDQFYGDLNKKQLRAVSNISKSGRHLLNLINSILDLSKIEAGKHKLDYEIIELVNKLNMIRNSLLPIAKTKNLKIEINVDQEINSIYADEDKFTQIMYNLMDNAIKFSYENNQIIIEARRKKEMVEIMVKDHGIGIKKEDHHKLFKPFSQIDSFSSKRSQGTGLGLSLVKQFVKMHGGYIWFRSNFGEGSTFAFTIPLNNNLYSK